MTATTIFRAASFRGLCLCAALAASACVGVAQKPVRELTVSAPVDHLDALAREPMVVEHPSGALFVAGYGSLSPTLWKSSDEGANWSRVDVGTTDAGAIGNSDVDLAVAPDGTLYFISMVFDREALEGRSISIGVSRDAGATWSWTRLSNTRFDDRPWIEVAPDGRAHAIWNDGKGVRHAISEDHGATWKELARVHPHGGSSFLAIGPSGELAVRIAPLSASGNLFDAGVDLISISEDHGVTWRDVPAPGHRDWTPLKDASGQWIEAEPQQPRWVEPLAWDATGALFSFWADGRDLWLARSRDRGATWERWRVGQSAQIAYYPYMTARGRGELAVSWSAGVGDQLQAHVGVLQVPDGAGAPRLVEAAPLTLNTWSEGVRAPAGEYLAVTFLRDGSVALVSPVQNTAAQQLGFSFRRIELR